MKVWSDFLDYVLPWTPGVDQEMAKHAIKLAAIEFFSESRVYRCELPPVSTAIGVVSPITLQFMGDLRIVRVERVRLDGGHELTPLRPSDVTVEMLYDSGAPTHFTSFIGLCCDGYDGCAQTIFSGSGGGAGSVLTVLPVPDAVYTLIPTVSLCPSLSSTVIARDDLVETYAIDIADGAIGRLLAMPKKPWSDPAAAALHLGRFKHAITRATDKADSGYTDAPARTRSVFGLR